MAPTLEALGIDRMSVLDRVSLVQAIWDSIAPEVEATELPEAVKAELDRRLAVHRANPNAAIPWERIHAEAMARVSK